MANTLYLASRSPRRRELLKQIGVAFHLVLLREGSTRGTDIDESALEGEEPAAYALRVACAKASAGARMIGLRRLPPLPVLSADTTVVCDGRIIGKPADGAEAARILESLSGRAHEVVTAVAVACGARLEHAVSVSKVSFRELAHDEIRRYVETGEPLDKAGAYAIQGRAACFATRIEGSFSGIMGLPLAETAVLLRSFGIVVP